MDWLELLRRMCAERGSQAKVAEELGLSKTTVSLVLAGKYPARSEAIGAAVLEVYGQSDIARALQAEPAWLAALRAEVKRSSQARTANRLGVSEATVSQVLSGNYRANTLRIERRVRGELLGEECDCPVLYGDLPMQVCQEIQEQPASRHFANPTHQQAWYACRGMGRFEAAGPCPFFNCGSNKSPSASPSPTPQE